MRQLEAFIVLCLAAITAITGCGSPKGPATSLPARSRPFEGTLAVAVISRAPGASAPDFGRAVDAAGPGETDRALAEELAAALDAAGLGVVSSLRAARAAARSLGAKLLLTCGVGEYDPYDPQRLVLRLALEDVERARLSPGDVMAIGRAAAPKPPSRRATLWAATARIDAGAESILRAFALERGRIGMRKDLVEASILIRDPARFFPFAARLVASRVPVRPVGLAAAAAR